MQTIRDINLENKKVIKLDSEKTLFSKIWNNKK